MRRLYFVLILLVAGMAAFAQQNVSLRIHHWLGTTPFQFGTAVTGNNVDSFTVRRLQYYVSEIILTHDGGIETIVPDVWILTDPSQMTEQALGSFAITNLESISLGIGVQASYNHLDPSSYPANHPLALQSPSMHWGWSAGYFFAAMEGRSGAGLANNYEIHALDDVNYFHTTITTTGSMSGQDLVIDLDADYIKALKSIDVSTGPVYHGASGIATTLLQNFRDFVFSPAVLTRVDEPVKPTFSIAPNPTAGHTRIEVGAAQGNHSQFVVYDYTGRILKTVQPQAGVAELDIAVPGCYLVALVRNGQTLVTKRLVVAH